MLNMKSKNFLFIISCFVIVILLIMALYTNALSNRYEKLDQGLVLDKWTKTVYFGPDPIYRLNSK